ncbi:MAG: winged helix-turn-helix transcriptional regulator [Candidatus Hodarchaeota archaeon]
MEIFKYNEFESFKEIIKTSRPLIRKALDKHFTETIHDEKRKIDEIRFFLNIFKFVTKKWNVEILYELEIHNGLIFNDITRHLEKISSRTLSDCLKQLLELELITRTVQDTHPPSVLYNLSHKGKGFVELSLILIYYLADIPAK